MPRHDNETYQLTDSGGRSSIFLVVGLIGLALGVVGYFVDRQQFFFSWLVAFVFWLSLALGALFFTMLHHLVNARWSVVVRRLAENMMTTLPVLALLAIPVLLGIPQLYHWSHADVVAADHLLAGKAAYLNTPFFVIRTAGYFLIWFLLYRLLFSASLRQDKAPTDALTRRMRVTSAPGMILFALTVTFASFDWLMSLDAHWYSTIFGVYVFAGCVLGMLSFLTLLVLRLQKSQVLAGTISPEHYHDLGKLMFAFTVFWAYMAFSQYFLIWYGNIPEETIWFLHRWTGSWKLVSLIIVFGHFGVPFFLLFPRGPKRNPRIMRFIAVWLLVVHWIDLYWIAMPTLHPHGAHPSWLDPVCLIGIGGIFIWVCWRSIARHPLVPVGDPNLDASIRSVSP